MVSVWATVQRHNGGKEVGCACVKKNIWEKYLGKITGRHCYRVADIFQVVCYEGLG